MGSDANALANTASDLLGIAPRRYSQELAMPSSSARHQICPSGSAWRYASQPNCLRARRGPNAHIRPRRVQSRKQNRSVVRRGAIPDLRATPVKKVVSQRFRATRQPLRTPAAAASLCHSILFDRRQERFFGLSRPFISNANLGRCLLRYQIQRRVRPLTIRDCFLPAANSAARRSPLIGLLSPSMIIARFPSSDASPPLVRTSAAVLPQTTTTNSSPLHIVPPYPSRGPATDSRRYIHKTFIASHDHRYRFELFNRSSVEPSTAPPACRTAEFPVRHSLQCLVERPPIRKPVVHRSSRWPPRRSARANGSVAFASARSNRPCNS